MYMESDYYGAKTATGEQNARIDAANEAEAERERAEYEAEYRAALQEVA